MRDGPRHRKGLGDLADPKLIARLTEWLEASGACELEIQNVDGQSLVLVSGGSRHGNDHEVTTDTVKAPLAGRFLILGDIAPGRSVRAGEILGLIEIGLLRLPLPSPVKGVLRGIQARNGDLIGYGSTLFTVELTA